MLIGLYGTHCVGKTTFLEGLDVPGIRKVFGDVLVVNYENVVEFPPESKYYRDKDGKLELMEFMIEDTSRLWVAEGMRFWGSMFHHVAPIVERANGGLFMFVITTTAEYMEQALRDRAVMNNKPYRDDYWTPKKLAYESGARMINTVGKRFNESEWMSVHFDGDDFKQWTDTAELVIRMFTTRHDLWYERSPVSYRGKRCPV